jgi:hypothetical protein
MRDEGGRRQEAGSRKQEAGVLISILVISQYG